MYSYSVAARRLSLHPSITGFLSHLFQDKAVVLQSLTFWRSSEQAQHADYAYVPAHIRSQLAATWIALEDIQPDSGPLCYFPGSHIARKFDWGNGIIRMPESTKDDGHFAEHLHDQAQLHGNELQTFCPRKGDVLFWHGAPVTRRSGGDEPRAHTPELRDPLLAGFDAPMGLIGCPPRRPGAANSTATTTTSIHSLRIARTAFRTVPSPCLARTTHECARRCVQSASRLGGWRQRDLDAPEPRHHPVSDRVHEDDDPGHLQDLFDRLKSDVQQVLAPRDFEAEPA